MIRRGKAASPSTSGQVAVQVPQLKQAETSVGPEALEVGVEAGVGLGGHDVLPVRSYWK